MQPDAAKILSSLFRVGPVTSIDDVGQRVRVTFGDMDNLVSPWLQVACRGSGQDDEYWMPDINDQVLCLMMPTGNAEGYVLCSVRGNTPKAGAVGKRYVRFADGSEVEFDRASGTLTIITTGPVNITAAGNVNVTGDVIAGGVSLKNHTHGGVVSGGGSTGKPN
ncbi:phage baseplate assembly protein V [Pelosinus sp. IPA-1]|uniref:phage baseplate assembly protein V n=1 Tax=Pelosinus sp. IPA-1 TaxID=3029569 RepID=UPI0024361F00|nr:phage baseplate assembly protein V [Pelosinus sp. IPA-1]GMB00442.1 hypothetical protein PIPA1_32410 [Pelosinus sp. IPA-1]